MITIKPQTSYFLILLRLAKVEILVILKASLILPSSSFKMICSFFSALTQDIVGQTTNMVFATGASLR